MMLAVKMNDLNRSYEALDDVCSEPKDLLKYLHCSKLYKTK